jgi:hypothetical protein
MRAYVLTPPSPPWPTPGASRTMRRKPIHTDVHLAVFIVVSAPPGRRMYGPGTNEAREAEHLPGLSTVTPRGSARGGHEPGAPRVREASGLGQ